MKQTADFIKFTFQRKWLEFMCTLPDEREQLAFIKSILNFAFYKEPPAALKGTTLDYFNGQVKPALNRQRRTFDYRAKVYGYGKDSGKGGHHGE